MCLLALLLARRTAYGAQPTLGCVSAVGQRFGVCVTPLPWHEACLPASMIAH